MLSVQNATFSRNPQGVPCIALDDAAFARADIVFIDPSSGQVSGLLGQLHFAIGTVPPALAEIFMKHSSVILTAPHPMGHDVALTAPVQTLH